MTSVYSLLFVALSATSYAATIKEAIEAFSTDENVLEALNKKQSEPAEAAKIFSDGKVEVFAVTRLIEVGFNKTRHVIALVRFEGNKTQVTLSEIKPLEMPRQAGAASDEFEAFESDPKIEEQVGGAKTEEAVRLELATEEVDDGDMEEFLMVQLVHSTKEPGTLRAVLAVAHVDPISLTIQKVEIVPKSVPKKE